MRGTSHFVIPKYSSFTTTTSSFSSVSVRLPPRFFLRRLTDTYDLGNLPKTSVDFTEARAVISAGSACVKTLRTSKGWENIPQNRIKTGAKWETYPFLCEFLLCRWENFSCAALFLEFLHCLRMREPSRPWMANYRHFPRPSCHRQKDAVLRVSSLIRALRATRKSAPGGFFPVKRLREWLCLGSAPTLGRFPRTQVSGKPPLKRKSAAATDTNARE